MVGATLAQVNVYPPRAGRLMKALRSSLPLHRMYQAARDVRGPSTIWSVVRRMLQSPQVDELTPGLVLRMCLPGWAHAHVGNCARGAIFAVMYWSCVVYAVLALGSYFGALAIGLAFAFHAASIIDLLISEDVEFYRRLFVIPAIVLAVLGAGYWGLGSVAARVIVSRQLVRDAGPFRAGDVVLTNPNAYYSSPPQLGDVVLFRVPGGVDRIRTRGAGREPVYYQVNGERIDRIIAGPGSQVRWSDNKLWVNEQPSDLRPLNPQRLPQDLTLHVPSGHYGILISTDVVLGANTPPVIWQHVCSVPADRIVGRAVVRNYPLSRWWWIR